MAKYTCVGSSLELGDEAGTTFTPVPQVQNIDMPQATSEELESTTLDTLTGYREFLPSFKDAGEMTVTMVFDPALHTGTGKIFDLFKTQETRPVKVGLATEPASELTGNAFVRDAGMGPVGPDEILMFTCVLRMSGAWDITPVTP